MNGAVAFVASTLPFQQIARYYRELRLTEVVCAGPLLAGSYRKGFERLGLDLPVSGLSGGTWSSSLQLLYRLLRARDIVIFHECCWFQIDFLILLSRRKVRYFPTVILTGRKKVAVRDLPLRNRLRGILVSRWFDAYETPMDSVEGVYYAFAVKDRFRKADPNGALSGPVSPAAGHSDKSGKLAVLVLCSTDPVPDQLLRDEYTKIIDRLAAAGVEVHVKDHPRSDARLYLSHPEAKEVDATLPVECLDLSGYAAFLSVGSNSVAAGRGYGEIISIARLLPDEYRDALDVRLLHLKSVGITPHLPRSINELLDIVGIKPGTGTR